MTELVNWKYFPKEIETLILQHVGWPFDKIKYLTYVVYLHWNIDAKMPEFLREHLKRCGYTLKVLERIDENIYSIRRTLTYENMDGTTPLEIENVRALMHQENSPNLIRDKAPILNREHVLDAIEFKDINPISRISRVCLKGNNQFICGADRVGNYWRFPVFIYADRLSFTTLILETYDANGVMISDMSLFNNTYLKYVVWYIKSRLIVDNIRSYPEYMVFKEHDTIIELRYNNGEITPRVVMKKGDEGYDILFQV